MQAMVDIFTLLPFITSCKIGEQVAGRVLFVVPHFLFAVLDSTVH